MKRRRFLEKAAIGSISIFADRASGASEPDVGRFPVEPRKRLAVASYPFRADFSPGKGKQDLTAFPQMVADRFGVHGIEPLDEHFRETSPAYLGKLQAALDQAGSRVVNIPVGRIPSFGDPDGDRRGLAIAKAKSWIDVAARLNCPGIRTHVARAKSGSLDLARISGALKYVADYGAANNVVVNLENDDPGSEEAYFLIDVIRTANHPWLRALPDFCNSMLLNKGEDYNYGAVKAMFDHACSICHVKEEESEGAKIYKIDLAKTFGIARASGYKGYFSMEFDQEGDPYSGTGHLVTESLKILTTGPK